MGRYNKHNIIKLEQRVKNIYHADKSNPELYLALKELAEAILVTKKMTYNYEETDQISHNFASDIYMKINHEGLHIWHWTKYVWLRLYDYRSKFLSETRYTELLVEDVVDLDKMKYIAYPLAEMTYDGYNIAELSDIVDFIPNRVKEVYDKYVRYQEGSYEYNKVWCSVMLTIMRNKDFSSDNIILFQLDESYYNYVKFMLNLINKRLAVYFHKICGEDLSRRSEMRELLSGYKSVVDD